MSSKIKEPGNKKWDIYKELVSSGLMLTEILFSLASIALYFKPHSEHGFGKSVVIFSLS